MLVPSSQPIRAHSTILVGPLPFLEAGHQLDATSHLLWDADKRLRHEALFHQRQTDECLLRPLQRKPSRSIASSNVAVSGSPSTTYRIFCFTVPVAIADHLPWPFFQLDVPYRFCLAFANASAMAPTG